MRKVKYYKRLFLILFVVCLVQASYIFISMPVSPEPTRVVSNTALNDGASIFEVLYDSGGATVPFVYRYFVVGPRDDPGDDLARLKDLQPFLVTKTSGAIGQVVNNRVKLQVFDAIYDFHNVGSYVVDKKLKLVRFDLNSVSP